MIDSAEKILQMVQHLREILRSWGVEEQTAWLVAGILTTAILLISIFARLITMLKESHKITSSVADERDELEEIVFQQRGIRRLSSRDYSVEEMTTLTIIKRAFRSKPPNNNRKGVH